MNNIILFDDDHWKSLLPISYTRPIADFRVGILTIKQKWELYLEGEGSYITQDYLSKKYPIKIANENLVINSRYLPNKKLVRLILQLELNDAILHNDNLVAAKLGSQQFDKLVEKNELDELKGLDLNNDIDANDFIKRPYDIFRVNKNEIRKDYELLTKGRSSQELEEHHFYQGSENNIFIEEGAILEPAFINAEDGPVYIGKDTHVMQGAMIRGPFALCNNAVVKMGAKITGATTVGPYCKVGGEINNVVFQAYSNKAHDGYLGNSVIGEWCNLGADSNSSNLKNNYSNIKMWDYSTDTFSSSELQFCGIIMGDHSKTGINMMFNTGTVLGVSCNVFGSGFPRTIIPSFSWGGKKGYTTFKIEKSLEVARLVMARRALELSEEDKLIMEHIYHYSAQYRQWES